MKLCQTVLLVIQISIILYLSILIGFFFMAAHLSQQQEPESSIKNKLLGRFKFMSSSEFGGKPNKYGIN